MCFGRTQTPELPSTPAPSPVPMPSNVSPVATEGQRALKIAQMKKGILSTIKTSPVGITGAGVDLTGASVAGQKRTLGGS